MKTPNESRNDKELLEYPVKCVVTKGFLTKTVEILLVCCLIEKCPGVGVAQAPPVLVYSYCASKRGSFGPTECPN